RTGPRTPLDGSRYPSAAADADGWIATASVESPLTNFAIVVGDEAVGGIGLTLGIDVFRRSAEIGYWLGEPFWGRGIATETLHAVTEYAFDAFDVCRLEARVFEWDPASMRRLAEVCYVREGRARLGVTKDGRTGDRLLYALVRG